MWLWLAQTTPAAQCPARSNVTMSSLTAFPCCIPGTPVSQKPRPCLVVIILSRKPWQGYHSCDSCWPVQAAAGAGGALCSVLLPGRAQVTAAFPLCCPKASPSLINTETCPSLPLCQIQGTEISLVFLFSVSCQHLSYQTVFILSHL